MNDKTPLTDKHFRDWEAEAFGFGYGTGEQYTLPAIKSFFDNLIDNRSYDFEFMEKILGATVFWLLLNILANEDLIEYGTSPRYGWLTKEGELLRNYIHGKTPDELYDVVMNTPDDYYHCLRDHCNCDDAPCNNPLFPTPTP